jgi:hypothetical protein
MKQILDKINNCFPFHLPASRRLARSNIMLAAMS